MVLSFAFSVLSLFSCVQIISISKAVILVKFLLNVNLSRRFISFFRILLLVIFMKALADRLPRLGTRELILLLSFTCNRVVSVKRGSSSYWCLG